MPRGYTPAEARDIRLCKNSLDYYQRHLKILQKSPTKLIQYQPKPDQLKLRATIQKDWNVACLKARQIGISTEISAEFFWQAAFVPHTRVAVVAHKWQSAENLFRIYRTFYEGLPRHLKFKTKYSSKLELEFAHGSFIKVFTANSDATRSLSAVSCLHASEVAFWQDMGLTMSSLFQTCTDDAKIVIETTANGINQFFHWWEDDNGYQKVFLPWNQEPTYVWPFPPIKGFTREEQEYIERWELTDEQANWFAKTLRTKCDNNLDTFNQEYPASAGVAFIASGKRYFPVVYKSGTSTEEGYNEYQEPNKFKIYTMGVDCATGSPDGDLHAFAVLDVTRKHENVIKTAATYYGRASTSEYPELVAEVAKKYKAMVNVEVQGGYGIPVVNELIREKHPWQYRRVKFNNTSQEWITEDYGFATTQQTRAMILKRLYQYIKMGWLDCIDFRLRHEVNTFVYNDKGRPEASAGSHDDMVFAFALGLIAIDQIFAIEESPDEARQPGNVREMLEWELTTGKIWNRSRSLDPVESLMHDFEHQVY